MNNLISPFIPLTYPKSIIKCINDLCDIGIISSGFMSSNSITVDEDHLSKMEGFTPGNNEWYNVTRQSIYSSYFIIKAYSSRKTMKTTLCFWKTPEYTVNIALYTNTSIIDMSSYPDIISVINNYISRGEKIEGDRLTQITRVKNKCKYIKFEDVISVENVYKQGDIASIECLSGKEKFIIVLNKEKLSITISALEGEEENLDKNSVLYTQYINTKWWFILNSWSQTNNLYIDDILY